MHFVRINFKEYDHELIAEAVVSAGSKLFESIDEYTVLETGIQVDTVDALSEDEINQIATNLFDLGLEDFEIDASDNYENVNEVTLEDDEDFHEAFGDLAFAEEVGVFEAEYQGRTVKLNKPMQGDVKKFKVYVKNPKGNVVKVNFGSKEHKIKKSNPGAKKSFRARHNCDNPGPKHKARYWSCRKW